MINMFIYIFWFPLFYVFDTRKERRGKRGREKGRGKKEKREE
jgi:hypothetical protein